MPTLTWLGHSGVRLRDKQHTLFIDPFLTGNPAAPFKVEQVEACHFICVTHGHSDHIGDTVALAKTHKATVIATWELCRYFEAQGVATHALSVGGRHDFPFGRVKLTPAVHGIGGDRQADGSTSPPNTPVGFLLTFGGKTLYHSGDTALFSDMKLIGEAAKIAVACLPIGDNFTMGIEDAVRAAEFLDAERYVPIHFNTWDVVRADPVAFAFKVQNQGRKCSVLKPGDTLEY